VRPRALRPQLKRGPLGRACVTPGPRSRVSSWGTLLSWPLDSAPTALARYSMERRIFTVLAIVSALACHDHPLAVSSAQGLTLTLALTRTSLQRGEPDTITVTLKNIGLETVSLDVGGCPLLFYVTDARGATVVPAGGEWFCIEIVSRLTLAPGDQKPARFTWDTSSLRAGIYSIYGTFSAQTIHLQTPRAAVELH
jgi:hypothetical protein